MDSLARPWLARLHSVILICRRRRATNTNGRPSSHFCLCLVCKHSLFHLQASCYCSHHWRCIIRMFTSVTVHNLKCLRIFLMHIKSDFGDSCYNVCNGYIYLTISVAGEYFSETHWLMSEMRCHPANSKTVFLSLWKVDIVDWVLTQSWTRVSKHVKDYRYCVRAAVELLSWGPQLWTVPLPTTVSTRLSFVEDPVGKIRSQKGFSVKEINKTSFIIFISKCPFSIGLFLFHNGISQWDFYLMSLFIFMSHFTS